MGIPPVFPTVKISKRDGQPALGFLPKITKATPADGRKKQGIQIEIESGVDNSGSMKTTIDLPENEIQEAMKHTGAKTKTDAVNRAVADYNRRQRLARLAGRMGTFKDMMTRKDLRQMRERD
jgi:Arc/MetJ family transcription regulator